MGGRVRLLVLLTSAVFVVLLLCNIGSAVDLYFTDLEANVPGYYGRLMEERSGNTESCKKLMGGKSALWFSKPVENEMLISDGKWKVTYYAETDSSDRRQIKTYIYIYNNTGLHRLGYRFKYIESGGIVLKTVEFDFGSVKLHKGDRIAVEITWSKWAGDKWLKIYFNSNNFPSGLKTPEFQPLNQIPEFSPTTLVIGAALLIGGFAISRKN